MRIILKTLILISAIPFLTGFSCYALETAPEDMQAVGKQEISEKIPAEDCNITDAPVLIHGIFAGTETEVRTAASAATDIARVTIPLVQLSEEAENAYPELAESLMLYNDRNQKQMKSRLEELEEIYYAEAEKKTRKENESVLCDEMTPYIVRADSRVFSILNYNRFSYGSSDCGCRYRSTSYDSITGRKLQLKDVVTDIEAFREIAADKIKLKCQNRDRYVAKRFISALDDIDRTDGIAWNCCYGGIRLIINSADFYSGYSYVVLVMVTWEEAPQLFNARYADVPVTWITEQVKEIPIPADVLGKGNTEDLVIKDKEKESGCGWYSYKICSGGRYYNLDDLTSEAVFYLIKTEDRYYTCAFYMSDNKRSCGSVIDMRSMAMAEENAGNPAAAVCTEWRGADTGYTVRRIREVWNDPGSVLAENRKKTEPENPAMVLNSAVLTKYGPGGLGEAEIIRGVQTETVWEEKQTEELFGDFDYIWTETPKIYLTEEASGEFPELAESLTGYTSEQQEQKTGRMEELERTWRELKKNCPGENMTVLDTVSAYIMRSDSRIFSILNVRKIRNEASNDDYIEIGRFYDCCNFDTVTGKHLSLSDVVTDCDLLTETVRKKMQAESMEPVSVSDLTDAFHGIEKETGVFWNLGYGGLQMIFVPGDAGNNAGDVQTLVISWNDVPELFNPYYAVIPDAWTMPILEEVIYSVDVAGNGESEEIAVTTVQGKYGMQYSVTCGKRSTEQCGGMDFINGYLIRTGGRYYIYTFFDIEDGNSAFYIHDPKTMELIDESWTSNYWSAIMITDPGCFRLDLRFDVLSTYVSGRDYRVGEDGIPVPLSPFYEVSQVLKLMHPLTVDTVDEEGNVTGTAEFPADTLIYCIRTDGASYMDVRLISPLSVSKIEVFEGYWYYERNENSEADMSRQIYRIRLEREEDGPDLVNGMPIREMFDGTQWFG